MGRAAAEAGVALIVGVGGDAKEIVAGAVEAGSPQASVAFFVTAAEAGQALKGLLHPGDRILFKASRGVGLENALAEVIAQQERTP
ncbi:MAG: hypothetical protein R2724_26335 [Bryobacterales bacterium]